MAAQFDTSKLEIFQLHPMDNCGTARGTISADGHAMTVSPWWDNDGSTGEVCRCTCGFVSRQFSGNGAWQAGHDGPPQEHKFDETHAALREAVSVWESAQPWLLSESLMLDLPKGFWQEQTDKKLPPVLEDLRDYYSQNTPSWEELLERLRGVKDPGLSTNSDLFKVAVTHSGSEDGHSLPHNDPLEDAYSSIAHMRWKSTTRTPCNWWQRRMRRQTWQRN